MFELEKSGFEGSSKSPFMPLISIPAYLFIAACCNTCEKFQEGQPRVEKDNNGLAGAVKSRAERPKKPVLCFRNSLRLFIY
jgi:hypothetical protein